jgi:quinol-cytochrome oxidoreductase complex cytochrome b subunit
VWQSIVLRGPVVPRTDHERALVTAHTLLLHLRPVRVSARATRFTHTFGLGGSSLVLLLIMAASGLLMTLVYQPNATAAYQSIVTMEREVPFGSLVRGIHYWSAQLLIVVALAHAARVLLTGGFHGPRQFNWVAGVALFLLLLVSAFTGYLLPWDQLSYWAITVSTGMLSYVPVIGGALQRIARGGSDVGSTTIVAFYTLHTSIVPAMLVFVAAFHFWRVRKAGGVVVPPARPGEPEADEKILFLPHLLVREAMLALVIAAIVVVLGAIFPAPLGHHANPGMSPNPAKAPWYFMGLQELLVDVHPIVAVLVVPLLALGAGTLLPYLTADDEPSGAWFLSARGRRAAGLAAALGATVTIVAVLARAWLPRRMSVVASGWSVVTGGLLPLAGSVAGVVLFASWLRRRRGLSPNETAQAVVVMVFVAFAVLTAIGVWFRGAQMALAWPWDGGQ